MPAYVTVTPGWLKAQALEAAGLYLLPVILLARWLGDGGVDTVEGICRLRPLGPP